MLHLILILFFVSIILSGSQQNDIRRNLNPANFISQVLSQSTGINTNGFSFNLFRGHLSNHPIEIETDNIMLQQLIHGIGIGAGIVNQVNDAKEFINDSNMNRIITMLQNHIKQWSFIESQLLEPNVNLAMPEIIIPLKHLITALEILSKIFFNQGDMVNAKTSLESVCPLIELVMNYPKSSMSMSSFILHDHSRLDGSIEYSEECFDMLRQSYAELRKKESHRKKSIANKSNKKSSNSKNVPSISSDINIDDPIYSPDFDIEQHINNLRAPYDHLRDIPTNSASLSPSLMLNSKGNKMKRNKIYFDPSKIDLSLLMRNDLPLLLYEENNSVRQFDLDEVDGIGIEIGAEISFIDLKLSNDLIALMKRFVHENEIGRSMVIAETLDMMEWVKAELLIENVPDEMIDYQMEVGNIIVTIMKEVIIQGFIYISNEIHSIYETSVVSYLPSDLLTNIEYQKDQIRLFVLEIFEEIFESNMNDISNLSMNENDYDTADILIIETSSSSDTDDDNLRDRKIHESRREKRKRLEKLIDINTPLESPETMGILSSDSSDMTVAISMTLSYHFMYVTIILCLCTTIYILIRNFHYRYQILYNKLSKLKSNQTNTKKTINLSTNHNIWWTVLFGVIKSYLWGLEIIDIKKPITKETKPSVKTKTSSNINSKVNTVLPTNGTNMSTISTNSKWSLVLSQKYISVVKELFQWVNINKNNNIQTSELINPKEIKSNEIVENSNNSSPHSIDSSKAKDTVNEVENQDANEDNDDDNDDDDWIISNKQINKPETKSQKLNELTKFITNEFDFYDDIDQGEWIPAKQTTVHKKQTSTTNGKPINVTTPTPIKNVSLRPVKSISPSGNLNVKKDTKVIIESKQIVKSNIRGINMKSNGSPIIKANDKSNSLNSSRNVSSDQLSINGSLTNGGAWKNLSLGLNNEIISSTTPSPIITPINTKLKSPQQNIPEISLASIKLTENLPMQSIAEDDAMRIDLMTLITPPTSVKLKDDEYEYFTSNTAKDSAALILSDPIYEDIYNYNYTSDSLNNQVNNQSSNTGTFIYQSDSTQVEDIRSHNRLFGLSANAPTFTPSYVTYPPISEDISYLSSDVRLPIVWKVSIVCIVGIDPIERVYDVKLLTSNWDITNTHSLIKQSNNTRVWQLSIEVPISIQKFVYKYIIQDITGGLWEDLSGIKSIDLTTKNAIEDVIINVQTLNNKQI